MWARLRVQDGVKVGRRQVADLSRVMEYLHQQRDIEYDVTWIRETLEL